MLELVLLVDDDPDDNFFHRRTIERAGAAGEVRTCSGGEDALAWLADPANPVPELIFLDINMPRMTGWEFLAEYGALDEARRAGTTVVMLSSSDSPQDLARAEEFDAVRGYLPKPLTQESLQGLLPSLLPAR